MFPTRVADKFDADISSQNSKLSTQSLAVIPTQKKYRCPEFNVYTTTKRRQQGISTQPKTKAVYMPLMDTTPSDPDTMMTAQHLTHKTGQEFVVFTCNLQLYCVALHVMWTYRDQFPNVIKRLG